MLGSQGIESSELCRNHDEQFTTNRGVAEVNAEAEQSASGTQKAFFNMSLLFVCEKLV